MQIQESTSSMVTAANAIEAVCVIVQNAVGQDMATTLNNAPLTRAVVHQLALTEIKSVIAEKTGVI